METQHKSPEAEFMSMKSLPVLLSGLLCIALSGNASGQNGAPSFPPDVKTFKDRRDVCDYFRGNEEKINKKRAKELAARMKEHCAGTDKELASLKAKYKDDKTVSKSLAGYAEKTE
jgi:hypothetical protein